MGNKHLLTTEKENIAVLAAQGMTANRISGIVGRDPKTITAALKKPEIAGKVADLQEELAAGYHQLAQRMITSITDDDISKINAYQRTIAAAAATDKMRLLNNQSTGNVQIAAFFQAVQDSVE